MAGELEDILAEVRAHLDWEAAHGHSGIAVEAAGGPATAAPPSSVGRGAPAEGHAPPATVAAPATSGVPEDAMAIIRGLKNRPGATRAIVPSTPPPKAAGLEVLEAPKAAALPALPPRKSGGDRARLPLIAAEAAACTRCRLHEGRTKSVFSRGSADAEVLFIGEGPGHHEDQEGVPFVGPAGQLLDKMIEAMGLTREGVYICNVVKCRPPDNRTPLPDEAAECLPYLKEQIALVAPRIIVALGRCATENLACALPGRSWRGIWGTFEGIPVMPTYHPAFLLRSPDMKRPVWEDLQKVMQRLRA